MRAGVLIWAGAGAFAISACGGTQESYVGPSGEIVHETSCRGGKGDCFEAAHSTCGGSGFRALDSHSNSGGLLADALPGPITWYYLTYACGNPDGRMPLFPRQGHDMPVVISTGAGRAAPPLVAQTDCATTPLGYSCTSFGY